MLRVNCKLFGLKMESLDSPQSAGGCTLPDPSCSSRGDLDPAPEAVKPENDGQSLSKRQLKKLEKRRLWEESKVLRRAKTKMKKKELRERVRQGLVEDHLSRKQKKANTMKDSSCRVGIAVDMSFNHLMIEKDMAKCIKQIHRCYSINRKQKDPVQYCVTSFEGAAEKAISKHGGWENWDVGFTKKAYTDLENYPKENLVYLTSESDNVLTELKPEHLYIIGGLVDHNSHKGLCHSLAVEKGISHARLPIDEYLHMKTRKTLTIDHVFEILVNVTQNLSWEKAMLNVIAPRKMAAPKTVIKEESEQQ